MRAVSTLAAAVALLAAGCARTHISQGFGKANQAALSMQQPPLPSPPPPMRAGLDTQEADVVAATYLKALSGKTKVADPEPVLYLAPPQRPQAQPPLAPSVPKE